MFGLQFFLMLRRRLLSMQVIITFLLVCFAISRVESTRCGFISVSKHHHCNVKTHHLVDGRMSKIRLHTHPPQLIYLPSIITSSSDEVIMPDDISEAFQDTVSISDLTSDPTLQIAFAAAGAAIILLVVAKAIVQQMDDAVQKVAIDFDKVMTLKYAKKWHKFIPGEEGSIVVDSEEDRIQKILEEMEILSKEEPEFMERVMQDIERMKV